MSRHTGIPLLSGPPPTHTGPTKNTCRKCGKEFGILFHRERKCMHCGYGYCSSCTDYQALMPRSGPAHGYDLASVCAYCIEMLNITALGRIQLRSLPIAKLRRYINAYNIPVRNPIDKNDLVDAAVAARTPQGCLSPVNEDYYRKHSVPSFSTPGAAHSTSNNRNSSARGSSNTNANGGSRSNRPFPRPDLDPNMRNHSQGTSYNTYTPRSRTTSAPMNPRTARQAGGHRPTSSNGRQPAPRSASATREQSPPPPSQPLPPPPMSTLVTFPRSSLSLLSVSQLKQILWQARVRVPPGVVEKEELVERAWAVIEEEKRKDNEGIDDVDSELDEDVNDLGETDREEEVVVEIVNPESDPQRGEHETRHAASPTGHSLRPVTPQPSTSSPQSSSSPSNSAPKSKSRPTPKPTSVERSGLCVICQDEEACIAVIDCGHLAMCRDCSELVLASSRECPLCRTRIVTEARLLRIFKT